MADYIEYKTIEDDRVKTLDCYDEMMKDSDEIERGLIELIKQYEHKYDNDIAAGKCNMRKCYDINTGDFMGFRFGPRSINGLNK